MQDAFLEALAKLLLDCHGAAQVVAGVANAPDQLDFDNLATSGQHVARGSLLLHGASIGIEARC
jgi:fructose/tagatose bisphosphate aldolase